MDLSTLFAEAALAASSAEAVSTALSAEASSAASLSGTSSAAPVARTLESSVLMTLESRTAKFGHGEDQVEKATRPGSATGPFYGGSSMSQKQGQTRAHMAPDPPSLATQRTQELKSH